MLRSEYGIVVNIATAVLVISAKGSAAMAVLFAVTTLSSVLAGLTDKLVSPEAVAVAGRGGEPYR
jgi:hypothetical protein